MHMLDERKTIRVLKIYTMFLEGKTLNKINLANDFEVTERTIQRDIDDIRNFFDREMEQSGYRNQLIYDRKEKGYRLERIYKMKLTNPEILATCKVLLDSRCLTKKEMENIIDKLIECCVPEESQTLVKELVSNEKFHYIEPVHKTVFIDKLWQIGEAIRGSQYIEMDYLRTKDKKIVKRKVKPVAIMFSEYYFYVTAFIDDKEVRKDFDVINDSFPTIYRIDRIQGLKVLPERFHIPYSSRFEEGEFRKRIQFMYGGKLRRLKFKYMGNSVEAILDRLPTAQVVDEQEGVFTIQAEVFGNGVDMWLRSQGEQVEVV